MHREPSIRETPIPVTSSDDMAPESGSWPEGWKSYSFDSRKNVLTAEDFHSQLDEFFGNEDEEEGRTKCYGVILQHPGKPAEVFMQRASAVPTFKNYTVIGTPQYGYKASTDPDFDELGKNGLLQLTVPAKLTYFSVDHKVLTQSDEPLSSQVAACLEFDPPVTDEKSSNVRRPTLSEMAKRSIRYFTD